MRNQIKTQIKRSALLFCFFMFVGLAIPFLYGATLGNDVVSQTASGIEGKNKTDVARNIVSWEKENFKSPYFTEKYDSWYNEYLNIYVVDGIPRLPLLFGPSSWQISNRLANCGGYAQVFDSIAEENGINSSEVSAPGEDHVWNSYIDNKGDRVVMDSSGFGIIENKTKFAKRKGFTYVIRETEKGEEIVTDEYIETYNITMNLDEIDEVEVYSRYLQRNYERYGEPHKIIDRVNDGKITKLGEGPLTVKLKKNNGPLEKVYSKKIYLEKNIYFNSLKGFNQSFSLNV